MALLMQNFAIPEQVFLRTLHTYFPTYLFWSSGNCLALIFNELHFRCVYFKHFLLLLYVSRGWRFSFLDNCIAMRFSYEGNYDKAVESGLSRLRKYRLYWDVAILWEGLQNLGLCSALTGFERVGIFIVPHPWFGTSVCGHIRKTTV